MEQPEVPLEKSQEEIFDCARESPRRWTLGVALTAALLAVFAAITSLLSEHHVDEALIQQIQS